MQASCKSTELKAQTPRFRGLGVWSLVGLGFYAAHHNQVAAQVDVQVVQTGG